MSVDPKNNSISEMYQAIGCAISQWTRVEIQLYQIFSICLSLTVMQKGGGFSIGSPAPAAVLDAIDGFRPKLMMIDAALRTSLGNDPESKVILNEWADEKTSVNGLHGNRSKLAHWTVSQHFNHRGPDRVLLTPPPYSSRQHNGVMRSDVLRWEQNFEDAVARLGRIVERLTRHAVLQRRHVEQMASQVRALLPDDTSLLESLKQQLSDCL